MGYRELTASVTLVSTISCIIGPFLLVKSPLRRAGYRARSLIACACGVSGLLLLAYTTKTMSVLDAAEHSALGYALSLAAVLLVGLQQSLGENCACIRFQRFSKMALSCWGAGTGLAGILPPLVYGFISSWPLYQRFLAVIPIMVLYFAVCVGVYEAGRRRDDARTQQEDCAAVASPGQGASGPLLVAEPEHPVKSCFEVYLTFVFCAVYGLEYFVYPTLVDRATQCTPTAALGKNAYNMSWVFYNIGVTASRASIALFTFPCLWLVVVLQALNVFLWIIEVLTHALPQLKTQGYLIQYAWMTFVGLMGGTAYANCIRSFHCSPNIANHRRDRLISYAFAASQVVILASTALGNLLSSTVLTNAFVTRNCPTKLA
eukprot:TRINITY_DN65366_c0_g1_i1.p1 TRINITY_DN65366_c0_g1~~TRINITY_DN65366_c0_g1_i1.p1  ORF type:complete len:438 (-),score=59.53 TRINITY_DN65366_c0_g1_i1:418-1542(-)